MKLSRLNTTSNFLYSYFSYRIPTCYPTYLDFLLVLPHPTFFETLPKSSPKIIMPSQMTKQRFHHPAKHVTAIFCSPSKIKAEQIGRPPTLASTVQQFFGTLSSPLFVFSQLLFERPQKPLAVFFGQVTRRTFRGARA